ncbi:MAG TPA: alpha/beta fold hydrolase [Actinomycetota bacterium]|nr:alpha/beta fold hydrolase [Actinomycetota bacterium]
MTLTWAAARLAAPVSKRVAGIAASRLWFVPWRLRASDNTLSKWEAWLAGTERWSPSGRLDIAGFRAGEGPTVLLVHGWADRAATLGAFVEPLTHAGFQVIGIDMPAHGDSAGRRTDILEWAEVLRAAERDAGPFHAVIAHSVGAMAIGVAISEGLEAESLALIAPAVRMQSTLDRFRVQARLSPRAVEGLVDDISRRFGATVWEDFATDKLLRDRAASVLIVHDREDEQVPLTDGERLADAIDAELVETSGLGHTKILRDRKVIERVCSFVVAAETPAKKIKVEV